MYSAYLRSFKAEVVFGFVYFCEEGVGGTQALGLAQPGMAL